MADKVQIGWYTLKKDKVFCNRGFETASWYENILVKAGRYPVVCYDYSIDDNGEVRSHIGECYTLFDGVIVDDYFGSSFYGVPIGTYDTEKNAGRLSHYSEFRYLYDLADYLLHGQEWDYKLPKDEDGEYELFPQYEPRDIVFYSNLDKCNKTTHGIFLKQED